MNRFQFASILSIGLVFLCTVLAIASVFEDVWKEGAQTSQFVGSWKGKESWGTTWTITRRPNGTFSETIDFSQADVPHHPEIVKSEGRFFVRGSTYGYYYTKSTDPDFITSPRTVFDIDSLSDTKFSYRVCEGNWADETKSPGRLAP